MGSANLDTPSLFGLHETNLELYSGPVADGLEAMFELDKTNADELTLEGWEDRPLPVKVVEWALAPLRIFGRDAQRGNPRGRAPKERRERPVSPPGPCWPEQKRSGVAP